MPAESGAAALHLAPLQATDLGLYVQLYSDAQVQQHIAPPRTRATIVADFHAALALPHGPLGQGTQRRVLRLADAGGIGLLAVDERGSVLELGLMLLTPWQRRGIGRRAVATALIELARHASGRRVQVQYQSGNRAMAALAQALGFAAPERDPRSGRLKQTLDLCAAPQSPWRS
jgi:RimJ/RimL family protein N-acetyltransferase